MNTQQTYLDKSRIIQSSRLLRKIGFVAGFALISSLATTQAELVKHDVAAGFLVVSNKVFPADIANNNDCVVTLTQSINDFRLGTYNRADYNVQVGPSAPENSLKGVLMACIAQNGRNNYGTNSFPTPSIELNTPGDYRICSWLAVDGGSAGSAFEYNANVAGAWFPYATWLGGYVRNSGRTNGGTMDYFIGSPGLVLGTHLSNPSAGRFIVDLTEFGVDSRTDGILLVTHAKDENNFALSSVNTANGTWNVTVKDNNNGSAASVEQDPVAFVFVPKTNTAVISGRFRGDGTIEMFSGDSPQFSVAPAGAGRCKLTIPGHNARNGILIISAEGGFPYNMDNIVSYQASDDGNSWEIQSRDTPKNGLQTPGGGSEPFASFIYIPAPSAGVTVSPTKNLLTTESGGTASFTVSLHAQPTANVTFNVTSDNPAEGIPSTSMLTFTPANWNTPQTVTIYGVDDNVADGSVAYHIILSPGVSADPSYNGLDPEDVSVVNADNEPGITLSATDLTTTEAGGSASFTVVLNTQPASDVTIGLSSSDITEGTLSVSSLTFTPLNWYQPQTVTVTGVDDLIADGNVAYTIITAPAVSADATYNGFNAADVSVVNIDNDVAGFVVTPSSGLVVSESGSSTNFSIALSSEPTANVVVNISSSDLTEGTVSPTSLTFTPLNWYASQNVTLTGVDDFINDGDITYSINLSASSADSLYASQHLSISAKTIDNEAAITLPLGPIIYGIGTPGIAIDAAATVADSNNLNYNSGSLTVTLVSNAGPDDRLEIRNNGTGAGEIGVAGSDVTFGGTKIGTFSGGAGSTPLVITLNASATPAAAQALIRAITFRNINPDPSVAVRTVEFSLANGIGGVSKASKTIQLRLVRIYEFQQGVDNGLGVYTGAVDAEVTSLAPGSSFTAGTSTNGISIAWKEGATPTSTALLRFNNIIGDGLAQIPTNAILVSADLILNVNASGSGSPLYRMLVDWDDSRSWNSMSEWGGVPQDDQISRQTFDSQIGVNTNSAGAYTGSTGKGAIEVSVLPDVQAWLNGEANYGWVMPGWLFNPTATSFSPSESANSAERPRLRVKWLPAGSVSTASFRQNVNGYTGAKDTTIVEARPNQDNSKSTSVFVDYEVNSGLEDPQQVLLRFDDIIGTGSGQIPPGSIIHAAVIDFGNTVPNAMGNGGQFFAMLKPWDDTTTWNAWNGVGISPNGIDALATPSASAGTVNLTPNVQGGYVTYELTADVQAWVNGVRPNYGWAILPWPLGGDGWGFGTAEAADERDRPQLRVYYTPGTLPETISMLPLARTETSVVVRFSGAIGSTYSVQRTQAITGPWDTIGTATVGQDGTASYSDNTPLPNTAFYRVSHP